MLAARKRSLNRWYPRWPTGTEIAAFLEDRQARGLSPRTLQFYRSELGTWRDWLQGHGVSDLADVSADNLRRWLLDLGQRRNPGGVHANYRSIRAFLRWSWDENEIDVLNPIRRVRAPRVPQVHLEPVQLRDLKAMLETCDPDRFTGCRDRALLLALLDTGCRATEFLRIDLRDVDMATGAVLVRHGKGSRQRVTFLGARSRRALRAYLRYRINPGPDEPLWVSTHDARLTYAGLREIARRRAKRAGVRAPPLHSFRRAFAITSLRNGVDLISLQRLMGHSDLCLLPRYLRQTGADLQEAHRKAGPVDSNLL